MRPLTPLIVALTCCSFLQADDQATPLPERIEDGKGQAPKNGTEAENKEKPNSKSNRSPTKVAFEPFTGKVTKNKVRLRLQPNFDGLSVRELNRDQLLVILGETEDFYAVQPFSDMKAYVFRTYVLDNVIEGTRVNIRLKPDVDAPVITQLNSGDRVSGQIYAANNKWLEIPVPSSARLYIAKEYITKVGDAGYLARQEKRRAEVFDLLNTTKAISGTEMKKPFNQINIDGIIANYQHIILDFKDFPEAGQEATHSLNELQNAYTKKKIAFLEQQSQHVSQNLEQKNKQLSQELQVHKSRLSQLEQQIQAPPLEQEIITFKKPTQMPYNMATWIPAENALIANWSQKTGHTDANIFYQDQKKQAFVLKGIIDPYNRPVKNKPGDFMLLNSSSRLPLAFLYSTQVNLQDYVGHEVAILVAPRFNYNYAFPAYFVISIE